MRDDDHSFVDDAIRDLAQAVEAELEEHPDPDELLALSRGELETERAAWVEDHVVWCRDCGSFFRDSSPFDDEAEPLDPGERDAQWQALRRRLHPLDDEGGATVSDTTAPAPTEPAMERGWRQLPYLRAAAMVLGALGLGVWIGYLAGGPGVQIPATANPEILDLVPPGSERQPGEGIREIAEDRLSVLVLQMQPAETDRRYDARFRDAAGEIALVVEGLERNEYDNLTLLLSAHTLPAGLYSIEVSEAGGEEVVERFALRVLPRPD